MKIYYSINKIKITKTFIFLIRRIKRDERKENLEKFYNLTGDTFEIESGKVLIDAENQETLEKEPNLQEVAYFFDKTWKWAKLPSRLFKTFN